MRYFSARKDEYPKLSVGDLVVIEHEFLAGDVARDTGLITCVDINFYKILWSHGHYNDFIGYEDFAWFFSKVKIYGRKAAHRSTVCW